MLRILCAITDRECQGICPEKRIERGTKRKCPCEYLPEEKNGMTWETHGKYGWHIDHKIPISAFNFESPKDLDFKKCWALINLQPMWAKENIRKGAKVEKPFQPSLTI